MRRGEAEVLGAVGVEGVTGAEEDGVRGGAGAVLVLCGWGAPLEASLRPPPMKYAAGTRRPRTTSRVISRPRLRRFGRARRPEDRRARPPRCKAALLPVGGADRLRRAGCMARESEDAK
ncbi:hypothetical protein GCM10018782_54680 [Streptomyces griseoaurantiacus]|nr:hypothetical protein GCM10018782_54680 [Streptomyces griseoaurantiacus]